MNTSADERYAALYVFATALPVVTAANPAVGPGCLLCALAAASDAACDEDERSAAPLFAASCQHTTAGWRGHASRANAAVRAAGLTRAGKAVFPKPVAIARPVVGKRARSPTDAKGAALGSAASIIAARGDFAARQRKYTAALQHFAECSAPAVSPAQQRENEQLWPIS
jgi:hypothetical protein